MVKDCVSKSVAVRASVFTEVVFFTDESQTRCCSLFWRFLGCSWSVCISKLRWQRSFCKDPSGRRWYEALSNAESQMWLSASLASSAGMLLETSGYGQIRENFHNYLFGKHPAEYGNFGCVGDSWDNLEQFDCFAGTGTAVWNGLGLLFFLPVFTGDEPVSDQFAVVFGRAAIPCFFRLCIQDKASQMVMPGWAAQL